MSCGDICESPNRQLKDLTAMVDFKMGVLVYHFDFMAPNMYSSFVPSQKT